MFIKNKLFFFFLAVFFYIGFISIIWPNIEIPFDRNNTSIGFLSINFINPINDTVRFILFLLPPLIFYLFFLRNSIKNTPKIKSFFYFHNDKRVETYLFIKDSYLILIFLSSFVILEFLNLDFPYNNYFDTLHDGDYLSAINNHLFYGGIWSTSFTVHGGENIIIPLFSEYLFGTSISNLKYTNYLFILCLKILSIILAFQLSQISDLKKELKFIFFLFLSF